MLNATFSVIFKRCVALSILLFLIFNKNEWSSIKDWNWVGTNFHSWIEFLCIINSWLLSRFGFSIEEKRGKALLGPWLRSSKHWLSTCLWDNLAIWKNYVPSILFFYDCIFSYSRLWLSANDASKRADAVKQKCRFMTKIFQLLSGFFGHLFTLKKCHCVWKSQWKSHCDRR